MILKKRMLHAVVISCIAPLAVNAAAPHAPLDLGNLFPQSIVKNLKKGDPKTLYKAIKQLLGEKQCKARTIAYLLKNLGINLNLQFGNATVLQHAAHKGDLTVVQILINAGALVDSDGDNTHNTPLHRAAAKGYANVVKLLLAGGAKVDQYDKDGNTALHYAALQESAETVQYLLEAGAVCTVRNSKDKSSLHLAAEHDKDKNFTLVISFLKERRTILALVLELVLPEVLIELVDGYLK